MPTVCPKQPTKITSVINPDSSVDKVGGNNDDDEEEHA